MVRSQTPLNTLQYGLDNEVLLERSGLDEFHVNHSVWTASSPRKLRFRQGYGLSLLTKQRGRQFKSKKLRTDTRQGYALEAARIWFTPQGLCDLKHKVRLSATLCFRNAFSDAEFR
jgi:hypothetical protein